MRPRPREARSPVNEEEIRAIVKQIEAEPERWLQWDWVNPGEHELDDTWAGWVRIGELELLDPRTCGTRMCVAGWAISRAGMLFDATSDGVYTREGAFVGWINDVATELLGLSKEQAERIFEDTAGSHWSEEGDRVYAIADLKAVITRATGISFDDEA